MLSYILRRLLMLIPIVVVMSAVAFFLIQLPPGDYVTMRIIQLQHGAIIVDAILERYGADRLRVSEAGIREGAILAAVHAGASWRDRLAPMARGWAESATGQLG